MRQTLIPFMPPSADPLVRQVDDTLRQLCGADEHLQPVLHDKLRALEQRVAWERTTTPAGAMLQLGVLRATVERLAGRADIDDEAADSLMQTAQRLTDSVLGFIEETHSLPREQIGLDYYCGRGAETVAWGENQQ